jgi:hypothetical protein
MTSGLHVWVALCCLYLVESLRLTTLTATVFRKRLFHKGWRAESPIAFPERTRWAWTIGNVLPFTYPIVVCQHQLLAYGTQEIGPNYGFTWSPGGAVRYEDIGSMQVENRSLCLNGATYVRFESRLHAEFESRRLRQFKMLNIEQRESSIRSAVNHSLAVSIRPTLERIMAGSRWTQRVVAGQWLAGFVIFPAALLLVGESMLLPCLALFWLFAVAIAMTYPRLRQQLAPRRKGFPWKSLLFALYPVAALRALDEFSEGCAAGADPVAICTELCDGVTRENTASRLYREALYPVPVANLGEHQIGGGQAVNAWFNSLLAGAIRDHLAKRLPGALESAPAQNTPLSRSYCPRCLTQFVADIDCCPDCADVPVRPFRRSRGAA